MMTNKPALRFNQTNEGKTITLLFNTPPTQQEFDFWAARLAQAVDYANRRCNSNVQIISWEKRAES